MFMRTNLLVRRFIKCSHEVKLVLFRAYCICLYDACLWSNYDTGCKTKLKLCYHKCIKMFFGFKRCDSVQRFCLCWVFRVLILCCIIAVLYFYMRGVNAQTCLSLICNRWCHINVFNVHVGLF